MSWPQHAWPLRKKRAGLKVITKNKAGEGAALLLWRDNEGCAARGVPRGGSGVPAAAERRAGGGEKKLEDFAVRVAQEDVGAGAARLRVCAAYDECCWLDKALAGLVLTKQNMADHLASWWTTA